MRPTAAPCRSTFLAPHAPHLCMFLGFLCGQAGEISPKVQVIALYACFAANFLFSRQPSSLHKTGGLSGDSPPILCHLAYNNRLS